MISDVYAMTGRQSEGKSSNVEFVGAPAWFPQSEVRERISEIRLSGRGDYVVAFTKLADDIAERYSLKAVRIEKLNSLLLQKRTRVTIDARWHFKWLGLYPVMGPVAARIAAQYRVPPNVLHLTATASLFGQREISLRFDHPPKNFLNDPSSFLIEPHRSYFYNAKRAQKADRVYSISTAGVGGFRVGGAVATAIFQTVAPVSNLEPSVPLPEPLRYVKGALALAANFRGADCNVESMILVGRICDARKWINVAARATATGRFDLPRGLSGSVAIGAIASWHPVPDPEKFYVTSPLVWGIGFLSGKKRKHGIHPSGSDFFGTVTLQRTYRVAEVVDVAPFLNAGVSILSRLPKHSLEKPYPLYAFTLGALTSWQKGRTDVDVAVSIPLVPVPGRVMFKIDVLCDQPSLR
jgi:hypothetical protein